MMCMHVGPSLVSLVMSSPVSVLSSSSLPYFRRASHWWQSRYEPMVHEHATDEAEEQQAHGDEAPIDAWSAVCRHHGDAMRCDAMR